MAFAPALDLGPLHAAAEQLAIRRPRGEVRVLFYARPGKPRNMYAAGVEALRLWAELLPDGVTGVVRFAGEEIADEVDLGPRARVEMLGKLSYDGYHDLLADSDVGLALMLSPHPGHLALELPLAGIPTVTNDFAGYRHEWVTGLTVSGTDPTSIADALLHTTDVARGLDAACAARLPGRPRGQPRAGGQRGSHRGCGLEAQALTSNRRDQGRVPGVVTELAAYPAEVHVDGLRRRPERRAPDVAHQLVTGDDLAGARYQGAQEVELLARQDHLGVPHPGASARRIEPDVLHLDHVVKVGNRGSLSSGLVKFHRAGLVSRALKIRRSQR